MKSIISMVMVAASLCFFLTACSNSSKTAGNTATDAPQMTGNDKDKHGCIGSAGYQWSEIRQECVRLFEVGVRLDPKAAGLDPALSAFAVFKSTGAGSKAEVFIPSQASSFLLDKSADGTWKNKSYTLTEWNGGYSLEDASGKLLYQKDGN